MAVSALAFLDARGRVVLARDYRGEVPVHAAERLAALLDDGVDGAPACPVAVLDGAAVVWLRHADVLLAAVLRPDGGAPLAAASALVFLGHVVRVFSEFFGALSEEALRDNFVAAYELLDEMMDAGQPQTSEPAVLRGLVTQQGVRLADLASPGQHAPAPPSAVPWRAEGIFYRKNEVFLDVVEAYSATLASDGTPIHTEIRGVVRARAQLSGMPELRLGFSERVSLGNAGLPNAAAGGAPIVLEDARFHQCVRLARFEADRTICFVPPDGDFELMAYRVAPPATARPPFSVAVALEAWTPSRLELVVRVESLLRRRAGALAVELLVPVPEDAASPALRTTAGAAVYAPERGGVVWTLGYLPGGASQRMRARLSFPSVRTARPAPLAPAQLRFEVPHHTASQLAVRYLKVVERAGYTALPWVRYVTQHGVFSVRMPEEANAAEAALIAGAE